MQRLLLHHVIGLLLMPTVVASGPGKRTRLQNNSCCRCAVTLQDGCELDARRGV